MSTKILLALDGSETSLKAAKHVGKVVCTCNSIDITLYHVIHRPPELSEHRGESTTGEEERLSEELHRKQKDWLTNSQNQVETLIFGPAKTILKENGVDKKTTPIRTKLESDAHPDVALAIIEEAKTGGYKVVVMGKRGSSRIKDCIIGSVAWKVVRHLEDCVIWIVD